MPCSAVLTAKRALVLLLRVLAQAYGVAAACSRDSPDQDIIRCCREVSLKVHPDRGGKARDQQRLNEARSAWESAKERARGQSSSASAASLPVVRVATPKAKAAARREFRVNATAALLTYQGMTDSSHWLRLNVFVADNMRPWNVKHWCTTLEACCSGLHAHVMLQFNSTVDKTAAAFLFEGVKPNIQPHDLCGEGLNRRKLQIGIDRGFFYVWANKVGTARDAEGNLCVAGNYAPVWTDECFRYQVLGAWPEKLWKQRKLATDTYKEYLFLTRDGVVSRKRNLDAAEQAEERLELAEIIADNTKRIRSNPALYKPFPEVPEVTAWLKLFEADALRYPVLLLLGASMSGKTEFAASLFKRPLELKVGPLLHFPDKLRSFDRKLHDGIVLDDVRDLQFLTENQDKLQGKYSAELEFGLTPGGQCKYEKYLFRTPFVATCNYSTLNLSFLDNHDWLSKSGNCVVVHYRGLANVQAA